MSHLPVVAKPAKDEAKELAQAHKAIAVLQYANLMQRVRFLPAADRAEAYELIEKRHDLEVELEALTIQRDIAMNENAEIKRVLKRQRREIDALKAIGHPAGTH